MHSQLLVPASSAEVTHAKHKVSGESRSSGRSFTSPRKEDDEEVLDGA